MNRRCSSMVQQSVMMFAIFFLLPLADIAGQTGPADAANAEIQRWDFTWFDEESQTFIDVNPDNPGKACSLNRGDIELYKPKPNSNANNNTNTQNTNIRQSWFEWLSMTAWVILFLVAALIIGVSIWFFLKMESRSGIDSGALGDDGFNISERIKQLPFQLTSSTKGNFHQLAKDAFKRGDYGNSIVLLFSHALLQLDKSGLIELKKGKTNRQYLLEINKHPDLSKYYESLMVPFEDCFFGGHQIPSQIADRCLKGIATFEDNIRQQVHSEAAV